MENIEFKLNTFHLCEIGDYVTSKLMECGVDGTSEMTIYLDDKEFNRVDEDLFYRMRKNADDVFVPSIGEIVLNFDKVRLVIKNNG